MKRKYYYIQDNITDEILSAWPNDSWDGIKNNSREIEDSLIFSSYNKALKVKKELEQQFLANGDTIDFEIIECFKEIIPRRTVWKSN